MLSAQRAPPAWYYSAKPAGSPLKAVPSSAGEFLRFGVHDCSVLERGACSPARFALEVAAMPEAASHLCEKQYSNMSRCSCIRITVSFCSFCFPRFLDLFDKEKREYAQAHTCALFAPAAFLGCEAECISSWRADCIEVPAAVANPASVPAAAGNENRGSICMVRRERSLCSPPARTGLEPPPLSMRSLRRALCLG